MRPRTIALAAVLLVAALAVSVPFFRSYTRAAALIVRMAGLQGEVQDALEWEKDAVSVYDTHVASRHGTLRARLYIPDHMHRAIVLVAGVNALGIDEPRLYGLAHEFASVGYAVLTPELPDLQRYDITARTTDMIEDAAAGAARPRRVRLLVRRPQRLPARAALPDARRGARRAGTGRDAGRPARRGVQEAARLRRRHCPAGRGAQAGAA
ncbi:MAG: hypothetical protein NTY02_05175 [Acidobacteria bacterium]|nr:hypothetical protein [Acidobacteriota bacterium]